MWTVTGSLFKMFGNHNCGRGFENLTLQKIGSAANLT